MCLEAATDMLDMKNMLKKYKDVSIPLDLIPNGLELPMNSTTSTPTR